MKIAVLTFDAFNELDSFVVAHLLNRQADKGWKAFITAPTERVTSRNGVVVDAQKPLEFTAEADAVIFGSGWKTRDVMMEDAVMRRISVDPRRQLIASQCSGAMMLARLGLLTGVPACTDHFTRPMLAEMGIEIVDRAFQANSNVATAGGCLSSQYIATWMVAKRLGVEVAQKMIYDVAPIGEKDEYIARALGAVMPFVESDVTPAVAAQ
jgi:transcriptional regulator GlxA family with amidase domain